jgi:hypothetical protein
VGLTFAASCQIAAFQSGAMSGACVNSKGEQNEPIRTDLKWLFDVCFGGIAATPKQIGAAIHHLGTLKRRSRNDD